MSVVFLPYADRTPDTQYHDLLSAILQNGQVTRSAHDESSLALLAPPPMHFNLANGVPLITERSFAKLWINPIGELLAFINGVRTLEGLRKFGVSDRWWDRWVTEEKCAKRGLQAGDLGPGSYGAAFHDFPTPDGPYNQVAAVIQQIREFPYLRSHRISNWIPQYQMRGAGITQGVVVTPCHGDMHFRVIGDALDLTMVQHKADMLAGVPSNMIQYAAFLMMVAHVTGFRAGTFHHVLIDAHIYQEVPPTESGIITQMEAVEIMLDRAPRRFPTLTLRNPPDDIFAFRGGHFELSDYEPHPAITGITTAI